MAIPNYPSPIVMCMGPKKLALASLVLRIKYYTNYHYNRYNTRYYIVFIFKINRIYKTIYYLFKKVKLYRILIRDNL